MKSVNQLVVKFLLEIYTTQLNVGLKISPYKIFQRDRVAKKDIPKIKDYNNNKKNVLVLSTVQTIVSSSFR